MTIVRLLVTRPQPESEYTAALLRAHGHHVLTTPLLQREPVAEAHFGTEGWGGILLTSASAIQVLTGERLDPLKHLPLLAVGARTAEAARQAGFADVRSADGDGVALAALAVRLFAGTRTPLLYLSAEDRACDLGAALAPHGITVHTVAVYRMVPLRALTPEARAALAARQIDGVLHYSARTAAAYVGCTDTGTLREAALAPMQFCLSEKVAVQLTKAGAASVRIAARPDEPALLALIPHP